MIDLKFGAHTKQLKNFKKRLAILTPAIKKCNFVSYYILIFGKQFHIDKLIHIDYTPTVLKPSFLLALLLYN